MKTPAEAYALASRPVQELLGHYMRADAAKQLLPYQHARMGEQGKKEKAKDRAAEIAGAKRGPFTPKQPPQLRAITGGKSDA